MYLPDPLDLIDPSRDCWWRPIPGIDAAAWVDWVASAGVDCSGPMPRAGLPGSVGAGSAAVSNDEGTGDGRTGSLWMYVSLAAVALAVLSCVARRLLVRERERENIFQIRILKRIPSASKLCLISLQLHPFLACVPPCRCVRSLASLF